MRRIRLPSFEAVIHIAITEVIVNAIWYGITKWVTIQSLARDWGFVILSVIVIVIVGWYLGRRKESPHHTKNNEKANTHIRLEQILEDDKNNIGSRIYSRDYIWDLKKLSEPDPYIDLTFTLINASVFAINIDGLTGRLLIEKHECAQPAELISIKCIPHGDHTGIRIRQRLTKDMETIITNRRNLIPQSKMDLAKKGRIEISLSDLHLSISLEIDNELLKTIPLSIGGNFEVNVY